VRATFLMLPLAGLALAILPALLSAQTVGGTEDLKMKYRFDGLATVDELGYTVSGAGDVDGDGFPDLIVGSPFADPSGLSGAGSAFVYSGADGSQLFRFDGMAVGDQLGKSVSGAGDVNGDGFADLIVGAPRAVTSGGSFAGSAFVYSGADGSQLFRFDGSVTSDELGGAVSGAGDVDGDGFADLIVGAMRADPNGLSEAGSAFVFSGADGSQLFRFDGQAVNDALGETVSGAGDVDGDELADLIVGAPNASPGGLPFAGSAFVFGSNPILTASSETFSVSAGVTIDYAIDFPDVDAGQEYGVLLSAKGTGPTLLKSLLIPLKKDSFFVASTKGNTPPQGMNFQGTLDLQGDAAAQFTAAPGSLSIKLIGRSIFLAVVNKMLDFSSVARRIDFMP